MPNYRRSYVPGGCFFFTVNLQRRNSDLLVRHVAPLRAAIRDVRQRHPFVVDAAVILPNHLHMIWTLPTECDDYSMRWRLIKADFSRSIPTGEHVSSSRRRKGERGIWQRRFHEHTIRDEEDLAEHIDYIHFNPVKHGYVDRPADWPHSSIHRYIARGMLDADWGTDGRSFEFERE